jgi:hypothetical protein
MLVSQDGIVKHVKPVPLRIVKNKREMQSAWEQILDCILDSDKDKLRCEIQMIAEAINAS